VTNPMMQALEIKTQIKRLSKVASTRQTQGGVLNDFNTFVETVMTDERGMPVKQGDIHKVWFEHVQECRNRGVYAGLLCPWGHGKSVQMAVAYPAWRLAQNPNLRVKIISASDEIARDRVSLIKNILEKEDGAYRQLFTHIKPDATRQWTGSKIYLQRTGHSPDPSLEAVSILSSRMGARADLIIFDDPVDLSNAIQKPVMRDKVKDSFRSGWLSRLEPHGEVVYIGTVWHEDDLSMTLLTNKQFSFLIQSINETLDGIDCRITNPGDK